MDVIKELRDVKAAIEDAMADGRISFIEAVRIARELVDVLVLVLPLLSAREAREKQSDDMGV